MNSELKSDLRESVFKEQTTVNKKVTLALKTLDGLSVAQFRVQKRLLNLTQACNITLASEKSERTEEMEIQAETHVENQEFHYNCEAVVSGKELKSTPLCVCQ